MNEIGDTNIFESIKNIIKKYCQSPLQDEGTVISASVEVIDSLTDVSGYDAYYGDVSPLVHIFVSEKKPVMIENYEI